METSQLFQPLAEFSITGLHNERNVTIPFDGAIKILVAQNGSGKTTVLNSLHALLFGKYEKIKTMQFEDISLKFKSGKFVKLQKNDFTSNIENIQTGMLQHFRSMFPIEFITALYEDYQTLTKAGIKKSSNYHIAVQETKKRFPTLPEDVLIQWLDGLAAELSNVALYNQNLTEARQIIREEFPFAPIYLPTYRRVEEDLKSLYVMPSGVGAVSTVIQFGMQDVQTTFDEITAEIKNSSIEWFAKVNGQMLGQLIKGVDVTVEMKASLVDNEALRIVLERVGDNMTPQEKQEIYELIKSNDIFNKHHDYLAYFLANLVKVYEKQKDKDDAIKKFTVISNKYLVDKEVFYDESAVNILIKRKKNGHKVSMDSLSSGEKQIISLFARLFLGERSNQVAIFFDEPELSLSMEWQKQILPDILASGICSFLFCTTHSPFIFENDLDKYTSGLELYIKEL